MLDIKTVRNLRIAIRIVLKTYSNFLVGRGTHRRILSRRREVSFRTHLSLVAVHATNPHVSIVHTGNTIGLYHFFSCAWLDDCSHWSHITWKRQLQLWIRVWRHDQQAKQSKNLIHRFDTWKSLAPCRLPASWFTIFTPCSRPCKRRGI